LAVTSASPKPRRRRRRTRKPAAASPRPRAKELVDRLLAKQATLKSSELAHAAAISRQAAQRHLRALVAAGRLVPAGKGRVAHYRLAPAGGRAPLQLRFPCAVLDEERVWQEARARFRALAALPPPGEAVFHYALTEMLNNAIDHSGSAEVEIAFERAGPRGLAFEVVDEGVGVFDNVRVVLGLASNLEALQELSKGKVTTLPDRHTGEGIFFTSKVADYFELDSGGLRWMVDNVRADMAVEPREPPRRGTRVRFEAGRRPRTTLEQVFAAFTRDFAFDRTRVVVKLFKSGERFVSRSEARRLMHGLERFKEVELDFGGVAAVGQGFVDEVFRVWARAHRRTRVRATHMSPTVAFMVRRGRPGSGSRR
jgi:anti-sigma regulatory factor (Ser/Thr protein kinase)